MEALQKFEYGSLKVETFYNGTDKLPNKVYLNGELILEDLTFRPSPLHSIDDTETMVSLLGFYTLRECDVDEDYFEALDCPKLRQWAEESEEADELRMMMYDFECKDDEDYLSDNEMTYEDCTKIENYITSL